MMPNKKLSFLLIVMLVVVMAACSGAKNTSGGGGGGGTPSSTTFTIGGSVSGLAGTGLVLQDNGADNLTITGTGTVQFTFKTVVSGAFAVTVLTQPSSPAQTCTVTGGQGMATANVNTVSVSCTTNPVTVTV